MSTESPALGPPVPALAAGTTTEYANRGWILAVMCLALVMVVAGVSMLANALPSIAADLDASQSSQQWIVDAYALTLAALLLPAGALGDRFGRRGALIAGIGHLRRRRRAVGARRLARRSSSRCRALMGIGAALLMPGTLSTITSVFPPEERAKAVGIWAGFAGAGGTLGILASGALLEQFCLGLGLRRHRRARGRRAASASILVVPSTQVEEHVALDPLGSVLSAVGIGLLVLGIIEGPDRGLDRSGHADRRSSAASVFLAAFVLDRAAHRRAAARPAPVPPPRLRHRLGVALPAVLRHVRLLLRVAAVPAARARLQHAWKPRSRCCR